MIEGSSEQVEEIRRLRQENEDLKSFAFLACHDLQAPLRHISMYIDNLASELKDSGFLENSQNAYGMSVIKSGAQKMTALIDNLMTLSRVENRPLQLESINLNSLCAQVAATVLEGLPESRICNIKWGQLPTIRGDQEELFQVMMNLCSNGLKFNIPGEPSQIEIAVDEKRSFWEITVSDNGLGVDHEDCESVFLPFMRLKNSEDYPGTGLGLSICQKIVKRHGGEVWVTSKPEGGAIFHFSIAKDLVDSPLASE